MCTVYEDFRMGIVHLPKDKLVVNTARTTSGSQDYYLSLNRRPWMQNTSLTQLHLISTKTLCVKTLKRGKRIQKQNSRNPIPSSISPCPLQLPLLSDGSSSAVWAFVLQWRTDGENTTVSTVYVSLLDMVKREDGRFGFEKYLTQGSPCSEGGPVSS